MRLTQIELVYRVLKEKPMTMLDVSFETNVLRANVCRYIRVMEKRGEVQKLFEARDKHTRHKAGYYTTDKNLFNRVDERQLKLFGEGEL